jgi:hypothetical protein
VCAIGNEVPNCRQLSEVAGIYSSDNIKDGRIFLQTSAPFPLRKTYRLSPLTAKSFSLDSSFKQDPVFKYTLLFSSQKFAIKPETKHSCFHISHSDKECQSPFNYAVYHVSCFTSRSFFTEDHNFLKELNHRETSL